MEISFKVKLYEIIHSDGKIEYRIMSIQERKRMSKTKKYRNILTATLLRNLKVSVAVRNLAT